MTHWTTPAPWGGGTATLVRQDACPSCASCGERSAVRISPRRPHHAKQEADATHGQCQHAFHVTSRVSCALAQSHPVADSRVSVLSVTHDGRHALRRIRHSRDACEMDSLPSRTAPTIAGAAARFSGTRVMHASSPPPVLHLLSPPPPVPTAPRRTSSPPDRQGCCSWLWLLSPPGGRHDAPWSWCPGGHAAMRRRRPRARPRHAPARHAPARHAPARAPWGSR